MSHISYKKKEVFTSNKFSLKIPCAEYSQDPQFEIYFEATKDSIINNNIPPIKRIYLSEIKAKMGINMQVITFTRFFAEGHFYCIEFEREGKQKYSLINQYPNPIEDILILPQKNTFGSSLCRTFHFSFSSLDPNRIGFCLSPANKSYVIEEVFLPMGIKNRLSINFDKPGSDPVFIRCLEAFSGKKQFVFYDKGLRNLSIFDPVTMQVIIHKVDPHIAPKELHGLDYLSLEIESSFEKSFNNGHKTFLIFSHRPKLLPQNPPGQSSSSSSALNSPVNSYRLIDFFIHPSSGHSFFSLEKSGENPENMEALINFLRLKHLISEPQVDIDLDGFKRDILEGCEDFSHSSHYQILLPLTETEYLRLQLEKTIFNSPLPNTAIEKIIQADFDIATEIPMRVQKLKSFNNEGSLNHLKKNGTFFETLHPEKLFFWKSTHPSLITNWALLSHQGRFLGQGIDFILKKLTEAFPPSHGLSVLLSIASQAIQVNPNKNIQLFIQKDPNTITVISSAMYQLTFMINDEPISMMLKFSSQWTLKNKDSHIEISLDRSTVYDELLTVYTNSQLSPSIKNKWNDFLNTLIKAYLEIQQKNDIQLPMHPLLPKLVPIENWE